MLLRILCLKAQALGRCRDGTCYRTTVSLFGDLSSQEGGSESVLRQPPLSYHVCTKFQQPYLGTDEDRCSHARRIVVRVCWHSGSWGLIDGY